MSLLLSTESCMKSETMSNSPHLPIYLNKKVCPKPKLLRREINLKPPLHIWQVANLKFLLKVPFF